ncbi:hypothetical protein [Streptomyces ipomoeae]|uniref:hypothetical protein n=1 Tax=Streptomyces ipomoeae TaxID=103232 RepID=UPI0015EFF965|nr:hypothetical protein [Streptomyces ipomoeae]MDX2936488.1 hypothetical protein [Streptomyces ipomoeae]
MDSVQVELGSIRFDGHPRDLNGDKGLLAVRVNHQTSLFFQARASAIITDTGTELP